MLQCIHEKCDIGGATVDFKEKLKKLRGERGISQQKLADAIFVSRSAVAKWEGGLGTPSDDSYLALSKFFGVECEYLKMDDAEIALVKRRRRLRIIGVVVELVAVALILAITTLLMASVFSDSYGITPELAVGSYADNPKFENHDVIIYYYIIMDVVRPDTGERRQVLGGFCPVRKVPYGYRVFSEDYSYRKLYMGGSNIGILYSIKGEHCYYNIIRILIAGEGIPIDIVFFDTVTIDGKAHDVELSSYFVTDKMPGGSMIIGSTEVVISEEIFE